LAKTRKQIEPRRIYVLDTNVMMHDPSAIFRFEEHDIFIPMTVLEELDAGRRGFRKRPATYARSAVFSTN
jgi:PhoH-like ATPase